MMAYSEKTFKTRDGLRLYYRDYPAAVPGKTPVLCMTGAPDNARMYDHIARHIATTRRVIVPDWRGHGRSDYDPNWEHYGYETDRDDMIELLAHEGISKVVAMGVSMGGTVILHLGEKRLDLLAAAIVNDIGPVLGEKGKQRLLRNNELPIVWDSYEEAARAKSERMGVGVKNRSPADWLRIAKLWCRMRDDGKIVPDTDPNFRLSVRGRPRPPDYWPQFEAMKGIPYLIIRGEGSDLLEQSTIDEMRRRKPDLASVVVPDRGHNPFLDEPAAVAAIDAFIANIP